MDIQILHLFPHLLSLYGEYGNVAVLQDQLTRMGHTVTVTKSETVPQSFDTYQMVYLGSGTEDNLIQACKRILPHRQTIAQAVEGGQLWLATGNAMTLFGQSVTRQDQTLPALDIFPYTTCIDDSKRFLGDVLSDSANTWGAPFVGFVNNSCIYTGICHPILNLLLGNRLGNDKASGAEGFRVHRFYGTQLIGPVLAKNPHFLAHFCAELTGDKPQIPSDSYIVKAYAVAVDELERRLKH